MEGPSEELILLMEEYDELSEKQMILSDRMDSIVEPIFQKSNKAEFKKFLVFMKDSITKFDYTSKNNRRNDEKS